MSINAKIIAVVAGTLLVGVAVIGYLFEQNYRRQVTQTSEEALRGSIGAFQNLCKDNTDMLAATVEAFASNQEINAAFARRDRAELLKITAPLFASYHKQYGITHWLYWETEPSSADGVKGLVSFLRTSTPEKHGELVERSMLARVARTKVFVDGLDLGNTGFAFRVVAPVYSKGRLCGYFEVGKDIGSFLDSMKQQSGKEYGLLLQKSRLDAAKWKASRASRGDRNNWDDMPALLVARNTYTDDSILRYDGSIDNLSESGRNLGLVDHAARIYSRGAFPLFDASGAKVGAIFVLSNITDIYQEARQSMFRGLFGIAVLMAAAGLVMCWIFKRLIVVRLERLIRIATRVVGGEFDLQVVPSAHDEVGRFEELFEQFRKVFVELVHSNEAVPQGRV